MNSEEKDTSIFVVNQSFVDPSTDPKTQISLAKFELFYAVAGLILGLVCILGGVVLFLHGVTGSTSWTTKILGAESTITDAAPGAVLFIVGLLFVLLTRYKYVHQKVQ